MANALQPKDQIRPSDQARERAAGALRAHYAAGRLDEAELERRVERAYAARTRAELKALFADLPWNPRSRERAAGFWRFQRDMLRAHAAAYAGVNGALVGIWALTGAGEFWPGGSLAGWGAFLGGHWAVLRAMRRSSEAGRRRPLDPPRRRRALSR